MKTLADLRRAIKPGVRLLCVENTLRPELNDRERIVTKAQGNGFFWEHNPKPEHAFTGTGCTCGTWKVEMPHWRTPEEQFEVHAKNADARSWTSYEKASEFTFDGDYFTMQLKPGTSVTIKVLGEVKA